MPLLKRKPFTPENPPADLKPSDEVFVCRHTDEVFLQTMSKSFFKRTILCNSLVLELQIYWKSSLTYSEALESEQEVIKQGNSLSSPLQRAALTLVHHIQRGRLANLCDEVFSYLKDRYQECEDVEVQHSSRSRKKGSFTRDKLKNFLKLSCERTNQCSEGFYFVKMLGSSAHSCPGAIEYLRYTVS
ncbi:hypothetical protein QZH41_019204 [Actinostola sp. cb2023]|nr:hypothetical protein QZH41_019204 [Actinostola sp. cb2023]